MTQPMVMVHSHFLLFYPALSLSLWTVTNNDHTAPPASPEPHGAYGAEPPQAIEPAVQYMQKIKRCCDPETYQQFLDILSRYHHKPETINEVHYEAKMH